MKNTLPSNSITQPSDEVLLRAYETVTQHWIHAEQERWQILYNFLTANAILVVAWSAVYSATITSKPVFLITLSGVGLLVALLWVAICTRVNDFIGLYADLGHKAEERLRLHTYGPFQVAQRMRHTPGPKKNQQEEVHFLHWPGRKVSSRAFVLIIPCLFAMLYIVLMFLSIRFIA